ncbi:MAG: hypothetical protein AAGC95_18200 [Pseudomonadota bacterium]
MMYSEADSVVHWLIAQRQMLSIWLSDIEKAADPGNATLAVKLKEHEKWLTQSIEDLMTAA